MNLGKAPVTESSNDGRHKLSETECNHEGNRRSLDPRRSVRSGDKDQSLGDDGDLEVNDRVHLWVVGKGSAQFVHARGTIDGHTKLVLEERRLDDNDDEHDPENMNSVRM